MLGSASDSCDGVATLTGQHVLDILLPAYAATYTPIGGGGSSSALQLAIDYAGGEIVCHPHQDNDGADAAAHLDLAVHANLTTGDGSFAESFDATVTLGAMQTDVSLALQGSVPIGDLHGTFAPRITGSWPTHVVSFGGDVSPPATGSGSTGTTTGLAEEQASDGSMGQVMGAGSWQ